MSTCPHVSYNVGDLLSEGMTDVEVYSAHVREVGILQRDHTVSEKPAR